jgi:hypothetical protein
MPFFLIGDEEPDDPIMHDAGLDGFGLFCAAGAFCMHHLTEGFVPSYYIANWQGGRKAAAKLVKLGIWGRVDGGYHFVEWKQRSKEQVLAAREAARLRQQRARNKSRDDEGDSDVTA